MLNKQMPEHIKHHRLAHHQMHDPRTKGCVYQALLRKALTLLCTFAPDSVKQPCTLGKKLGVKILNEYCKAVQGSLLVPAGTLRADLRYMVLEHLNERAECD
ncbi:hypothetical protein QJQ45_012297 [Haematococcus lacustris]|nr:hypothetical protein QJQ45_012297 [Haematococcus lacustris]